ncbi:MAG: AMP-dependent synthetase [Actinomycetospora chiangmaiensis]|nr:AMP-dependent synthetase [Actinomycetospora chiangmaiensis]
MYGVNSSVEAFPAPVSREITQRVRGAVSGADRRTGQAAAAPTICSHRVARWACGEGLEAGTAVALLVRDLGQAEAIRLGLTRVGLRVACLDGDGRGAGLADSLARSGATVVIADTALAEAYAGLMGRLASYPAVWWNGPGADFASLDLALAEQD